MGMTGIVVFAACMILVGVVLLWLLRSSDRLIPNGGMEWAGSVMSVLLILAAGFLMALALASSKRESAAQTVVGQPASDMAFLLLADDAPRRISAFQGRVVLMNFWATWCQPCVTELPELDRLQTDYEEKGLTVITITDEPRDVLELFEDLWPQFTVSGYVSPELIPEPYQTDLARGRPISYVLDRDGIIQEIILGAGNYEMFERYVLQYL